MTGGRARRKAAVSACTAVGRAKQIVTTDYSSSYEDDYSRRRSRGRAMAVEGFGEGRPRQVGSSTTTLRGESLAGDQEQTGSAPA